MSDWDEYGYIKPTKALRAKGGIKAQTKRGAFGASWWAKRWIAALESFHVGSRLSRGRAYARKGQVLSIDVDSGAIHAEVQGSRRTPYQVKINVKTLSDGNWRKVMEALSGQAIFTAKLLAGEIPQDIESVFDEARVSLFPAKSKDLETYCSCPDWSNPCKHIAAVYYLLGEAFDRDPFLIFKLRGMERETLIDLLARDEAPAAEVNRKSSSDSGPDATAAVTPEPLGTDVDVFWEGVAVPEDLLGEVRNPSLAAALPKQLGNFPFWRGNEPLIDALEPLYAQASQKAIAAFETRPR